MFTHFFLKAMALFCLSHQFDEVVGFRMKASFSESDDDSDGEEKTVEEKAAETGFTVLYFP